MMDNDKLANDIDILKTNLDTSKQTQLDLTNQKQKLIENNNTLMNNLKNLDKIVYGPGSNFVDRWITNESPLNEENNKTNISDKLIRKPKNKSVNSLTSPMKKSKDIKVSGEDKNTKVKLIDNKKHQ